MTIPSTIPCPDARLGLHALREMSLRAVIDGHQIDFIGVDTTKPPTPRNFGPRFQPRDRAGRFVAYEDYCHAMFDDLTLWESEDRLAELDWFNGQYWIV